MSAITKLFVALSILFLASTAAYAAPCDSLQALSDPAYAAQLSLRRQAIAQATAQGLQGQAYTGLVSSLIAAPTSQMTSQAQQDAAAAQARYSACLAAAVAAAATPH